MNILAVLRVLPQRRIIPVPNITSKGNRGFHTPLPSPPEIYVQYEIYREIGRSLRYRVDVVENRKTPARLETDGPLASLLTD
jgi:hypothetical protein